MNKQAVSVAKMERMRRAIERGGLPFRGFKTNPDGSVEALAGEPLTKGANAVKGRLKRDLDGGAAGLGSAQSFVARVMGLHLDHGFRGVPR